MKVQGMVLAALLTIAGIILAPYIQPAWVLSLVVIPFSLVLYLIHNTKYLSVSIIVIAALYGLMLLSLFTFSTTLAIVVIGEIVFRASGATKRSYLYFIAAALSGSSLVMVYLGVFLPLVILLGVLVAVLLKSALRGREDALMIEALGVAMTMALFLALNYRVDLSSLLVAAFIALLFGFVSYRFRAADLSGLFSGAIIGIILIVFADVNWFFIMLGFFVLGSAATRFKYAQKAGLGVEELHGGVRGYFNVFANGLVATAAAVLYGISMQPMFIALFLGSVASAAADTTASEIGVTRGAPYLITTFERVPPGTNGGVTLVGECAGICAASLIAVIAFLLQVADLQMVIVTICAGFTGTNMDSVIGATLENRGTIGNAGTNLIATLSGGLFAMFFYLPGI